MSDHEHRPDCPRFRLIVLPEGTIDLSVCWDQIGDIHEIATVLRDVADGLEHLPRDTRPVGSVGVVVPL